MFKSLLFALVIFIGVNAVAVQQNSQVPNGFHGYWELDPKLCGTFKGDGRLVISANQLHFYGSIGPVKAVVVENPRDVIVIAQMRAEGESWLGHHHFLLSEDLNTITDVLKHSNVTRHRCHGKSPY